MVKCAIRALFCCLNPGSRDRFNVTVICYCLSGKRRRGGGREGYNVVIKNIGFERMFGNWKVERLEEGIFFIGKYVLFRNIVILRKILYFIES